MFSSLEPWSIMRMLTSAREIASNTRAAVPLALTIPRPTMASSAMPSSMTTLSGRTRLLSEAMSFSSCPCRYSEATTTLMVSTPEGRCSKEISLSSRTSRTRRPKPISAFIRSFSMVMTEKPFLPAIPVMMRSVSYSFVPATIMVPGASGSLVLRMLIGMPALRTGKTASSWSTDAPI